MLALDLRRLTVLRRNATFTCRYGLLQLLMAGACRAAMPLPLDPVAQKSSFRNPGNLLLRAEDLQVRGGTDGH